jgi:hypothetical protein
MAVDPTQIDLSSLSSMYKVFDNLYRLWMCIWMWPYHITAALIDQSLGSELEFSITPRQQIIVKCGDSCCKPNSNRPHINVKNVQSV